jgi:hypothetical protein
MAYYDALIAAWNSPTQPPAGVTGLPLLAGDTTAQKIAKVNAWAVADPSMIVPAYMIYNAIVPSEWSALTPANQQLIRDILSQGTVDGSTGKTARTVLLSVFGVGTQTRANLAAIAAPFDNLTTPWTTKNGYPSTLNLNDAVAAGLV